jgi:hypothetical protein
MSIELAEQLKKDFTDKYVVVSEGVAELRRFDGLTGTVKTVNMSGRALVEFEGTEDIGWYDIDPAYLKVVDAPVKKKAPAAKPAEKTEANAKPAAKKTGGKSPLEMARAQGAAGASKTPAAKPSELGGKKLSPLELARQQGAAGSGKATPAKAEKTETAQPAGKKLSPLELARQQGAAGSGCAKPAAAEEKKSEVKIEAPATEEKPTEQKTSETPTTGPDGKPLSPLELARLQGPFKG